MTLAEQSQAGEALQDLGRTNPNGKGRTGIWRNEAKRGKSPTGNLAERSQRWKESTEDLAERSKSEGVPNRVWQNEAKNGLHAATPNASLF
jgi:hypothetical protein